MNDLIIPKGYVLVPEKWAEMYFNKSFWKDITEPTISDTAEYIGVSVDKIKKDLKNIDCPLRKANKGSKGRGNQIKFIKHSVEAYRDWLK